MTMPSGRSHVSANGGVDVVVAVGTVPMSSVSDEWSLAAAEAFA